MNLRIRNRIPRRRRAPEERPRTGAISKCKGRTSADDEGTERGKGDGDQADTAGSFQDEGTLFSQGYCALQPLKDISEDDAWDWAEKSKGPHLQELVDNLKASLAPWAHSYMLSEAATRLKTSSTSQRLLVEINGMLALGPKVLS